MGGSSKLMKAIYEDGLIYYGFVFLISLINVVVIVLLPPDLVHLLTAFERIMHSILTSRAILHIRRVTWEPSVNSHHLHETDVSLEHTFPQTRSV
ncbi:hypothetical protein PM082_022391 [Marasmius tenuissimus]|nr:hypothetical protein PM082_022391 [Marasmius tenuissimus]